MVKTGFCSFIALFHANSNDWAKKSHTATRLGTADQAYDWVYSFKRTSPLPAKPGNPATALLLQKLHCHPGGRVSSE